MAEKPVKVEIVGDSSKYKKALGEAEDASGKFSKATTGHGKAIAAASAVAAGAVGAFAADAIDAASDYSETVSKSKVIFGEASDTVIKFAEDAADSFGLSQQSALDAEATFATFGKGAGLAGEDLAMFAQDLTGLAADMASFSNTSPEQAIEAIGAALRGEAEPIRAYGVLLDDATLKQTAMELGIYNGVGALTQQQKVMAAQKAIFDQTGDAQGDFARTSEGLAGQTKILSAQFENLKVQIGSGLIPVAVKAIETINKFAFGGDAAADSFKKMAKELDPKKPADVANAFGKLVHETQNSRAMIDNARHGFADFFAQLGDGTILTSTEDLRNMTKAFGDLRDRSPEAAQQVVDALRVVVSAAENGSEAAQDYVKALDLTDEVLDELQATLPHVESATLDATSGFEHMGVTSHDASIKIAEASKELGEAATQAGAAQRATDNLAASWDALKGTLSDQQAWIDVENAFASAEEAGVASMTAIKDGTDDADQKARDYASSMITLKEKVIDYANEVGGLPPQVVSKILADIDEGSVTNAEQILDRIAHERQVIYNAQVAGHREFASGTNRAPSGLALVGEKGPELVAMRGGEKVYTASQTAGMLSNGSPVSGAPMNITINMPPGVNGDDVVRAIKKFEARNGPGWRS